MKLYTVSVKGCERENKRVGERRGEESERKVCGIHFYVKLKFIVCCRTSRRNVSGLRQASQGVVPAVGLKRGYEDP